MLMGMVLMAGCAAAPTAAPPDVPNARRPANDAELRYWLQNMVWYHGFDLGEIRAATGMSRTEIERALRRFRIEGAGPPARRSDGTPLVLPYPGGRHPRIGFLEGAVDPQRETKVSIFAPWDQGGYAVADVPEAIWCDGMLLYLAHTHVPTVWSEQGVELEKLEWNRHPDGTLDFERKLPNGVVFGTRVTPHQGGAVWMETWLHNGTTRTLTGLHMQMCVMLKGLADFSGLSDRDRQDARPYVAARSGDGRRWIITAWEPCRRLWINPLVPCLHSDPQLPDCPPGQTSRARGLLAFHEGENVEAVFRGLDASGWRGE
ncbi:MAG: hypothetical protein AMXMBFR83_27880 [Phycisphaerae bacterium]